MKIGYPCINRSIGCTAGHTFRLKSYSEERLFSAVGANLDCMRRMVDYNAARGMLFLRISSDVVPFASHPVCTHDWRSRFAGQFADLGRAIRAAKIRISMHPDQFTLINSPTTVIFERSVAELHYHADVLDLMKLGPDAKIQIHVGGVYGDKPSGMRRFCDRYQELPAKIRRRLVIENDERLYSVRDCLAISDVTGTPILFDYYHHALKPDGLTAVDAITRCSRTWKKKDGVMMVDYSSVKAGARFGSHAEHIDTKDFARFLKTMGDRPCDVMLEIKDKEVSAGIALKVARG